MGFRMKPLLPALLLLATFYARSAEPLATTVYRAGADGYASVRIPAVVVTAKGTLLAFAEGRAKHADQAQNDIVLRRSSDGGLTWGPLLKVADRGADSLNNPCPVIDRRNARIHLHYQSYPAHIHEWGKIETGVEGENIIRSWVQTSDDDGATWSEPRELTAQVKDPARATSLASGPGFGLLLERSPHAGRLVIPFNQGPRGDWTVYTAFSDDGGATWTRGQIAPNGPGVNNGNEVQVVERLDGSLLLNARQQNKRQKRLAAESKDGGATWSELREVPELFDGPCMASVFRVRSADGKPGPILFSGPTVGKRADGRLWVSRDDGATWTRGPAFPAGPFAYSVLTQLQDGTLGCLIETGATGPYERIDFLRFPVDWALSSAPN
jgi:sialidase-1